MNALSPPSSLVPFNFNLISVGCLSLSYLDFTLPQPTHPHSHVSPFISFQPAQSFPCSLVFLINDKVCASFPISSIPSQTRIGVFVEIDCEWRNVSVLQKTAKPFFLIPFFPPSFSLVFSLFCLSVPHFDVNALPFPFLPQNVVCF